MTNLILSIAGTLFIVLFSFLAFIFIIFLISFILPKKISRFEPNITVVIPAYNEEKRIAECINSTFKAYPNNKLDVVVVDDGSIDNTLNIQVV